MEYIIATILVLSFVACIIYILKGSNLMITMLIMATLWTALAIIGKYACGANFAEANATILGMSVNEILTNVYTDGPVGWGVVLVNVMFGAFFGRVLLDTGIVSTLIRKTVELGGDKPVVTNILLCVVSAACFTTMTGPGAVISIGVIVLPILLTLGIKKNVAVWSYVASVAAGFLLNPVIFAQYVAYFANAEGGTEYTYQDNLPWAAVTCGIMMVVILVYSSILTIRSGKEVSAWAAPREAAENNHVPGIALICPIIPILLVIIFQVNVILAMILTSVLALLLCGKGRSFGELSRSISKAFADGVVDSAAIMGFFLTVPMFCNAAALCAPYFKVLLAPIVPDNTLIIAIALAILAPLGMNRGPLTLMGAGVVTVGILNTIGMPTTLMFPFLTGTTIIMNCATDLTQSWNSWAVGYTKCETKDFLRLSIPVGWVMTAIVMIVSWVMRG